MRSHPGTDGGRPGDAVARSTIRIDPMVDAEVRALCALKQDPFPTPDRLVEYRNRKGTEQVDDLTLVSKADDWWTAWSQFYF